MADFAADSSAAAAISSQVCQLRMQIMKIRFEDFARDDQSSNLTALVLASATTHTPGSLCRGCLVGGLAQMGRGSFAGGGWG